MEKISELLAEARPAYRERQHKRQFALGAMCSLVAGVWFCAGVFDIVPGMIDGQFDAYYTALYDSDAAFSYDVDGANILPLDGYGLYEVS